MWKQLLSVRVNPAKKFLPQTRSSQPHEIRWVVSNAGVVTYDGSKSEWLLSVVADDPHPKWGPHVEGLSCEEFCSRQQLRSFLKEPPLRLNIRKIHYVKVCRSNPEHPLAIHKSLTQSQVESADQGRHLGGHGQLTPRVH